MSVKLNRRAFLGTALAFGAMCAVQPGEAVAVTSAEKKAEAQRVKAQLDSMNSELEQAVDQYNAAQDSYNDATAKVEECQTKIDDANQRLDTLNDRLSTRATAMYREGNTSYLSVLLGQHSFNDFVETVESLDKLNTEDAKLVQETKAAKEELDTAQAELEENQTAAKDALDTQASLKSSIESQSAQLQSTYDNLSTEVAELVQKEQEEEAQRQAAAAAAYTPSTTKSSSSSSSSSKSSSSSSSNKSSSSNSGSSSDSGSSAASSVPTHGSVVDYAASRIGCPYVWGASGPDSFDCSGLVMWCYAKIGISLPHYTESQYACASARLSPSDAAPGDVLYRSGHVAISTGGTNYIHAPHTGANVSYGSGGSWVCALRF